MRRSNRFWVLAAVMLSLLAAAAIVGFAAGHYTRAEGGSTQTAAQASTPVSPMVAAGAHDFAQFACAQCHGLNGRGGVSADVPVEL